MNKSLEQVQEFHFTFSHRIGNINELEPLNVRQLRIKLLFEELRELAEASDCKRTLVDETAKYVSSFSNNPTDVFKACTDAHDDWKITDGDDVNQLEELDALCDIQYVLNGKIITAGMQHIFDREFDKVHQNNMSKAHNSYWHASETADKLKLIDAKIVSKNGINHYVLTNSEGKIIKPHDHKKVELSLTPDL